MARSRGLGDVYKRQPAMPVKSLPSGGWKVTACVDYQRVHRHLPPGTPARDAKRFEAELVAALKRGREPVIPGDPRLIAVMALYIEAAEHLRSPDTAKHHAARIGNWVERYTASQARQCAAHIVADMQGHYKAATINRSLGTLKRALRLAWERGMTTVDYSAHVKRLPENNARTVYLTMEQVKLIADCASDNVRAAIWIALLTGCRRGEVCKIEKHHIGEDSIQVPAGNTKTMRTKTVPLVPALRQWVSYLPLAINYEGVKSGFRRAREKAGMPHVHFHDLRHSCATILLGVGVPLHVIRDILGHSTIKTTERYAHALIEPQRDAMNQLGVLHKALHKAKKRPPKGPLSA
jgi:integrase